MVQGETVTLHKTVTKSRISWPDLHDLIVQAVRKGTGHERGPNDTVTVVIEQQEEGSPRYRVSKWEARVEIVTDLSRLEPDHKAEVRTPPGIRPPA